jgi:Zn-dependent protease with chaperone function
MSVESTKAQSVGIWRARLIASLLIVAAPLVTLAIGVSLRSHLSGRRVFNGSGPVDPLCNDHGGTPLVAAQEYCYKFSATHTLIELSVILILVGLLLPVIYAGALRALARRRTLFAHAFRWTIRPVLLLVAAMVVMQALLLAYAGGQIAIDLDFNLLTGVVLFLAAAMVWSSFLIVVSAISQGHVEPLSVTGTLLREEALPGLRERVETLARQLKAQPPQHIVMGFEPRVFVTASNLRLRELELLLAGETLYLSPLFLRTLNPQELDAVIGHELGHFQAADLAFTEMVTPGLRVLTAALEDVSEDENDRDTNGYVALARIPAMVILNGFVAILLGTASAIRRDREFEADRSGVQVSSTSAMSAALVMAALFGLYWIPFYKRYSDLLAQGRARRNLSEDFVRQVGALAAGDFKGKLLKLLLATRTSHPFDIHPPLRERLRALGVDPEGFVSDMLTRISTPPSASKELTQIEEQLSEMETRRFHVPGRRYELDPA